MNAKDRTKEQLLDDLRQSELEISKLKILADKNKTTTDELNQERKLYADLANALSAGIYRLRTFREASLTSENWSNFKNAPYRIEFANDRFFEILNIDRVDFEKNPGMINDLIFEADKAEFVRMNVEANSNTTPFLWEGRIIIKENTFWIHFESTPRVLENGDILWTGTLNNITKRKIEELETALKTRELHEREERLQLIINLANEGIVIAHELNLVLVNPKMCEITGRSHDELKKTPFLDLIHPEDHEQVMNSRKTRLNGKTLESKYEIRILNSNDTIRWVEIHGEKIDWKGEPATLNFIKDITEAKTIAKTLRDSEAKYRYITENSSDVIWHLDKNLICDYISLADEKMRGYTQEEVLGTHLFDILKPGTYDHLIANLQKRFADEKAGITTKLAPSYELEEKCKDGSWVWVEATATPHHDEDGNLLGLNGVTRDISERKKAEAEVELKTKQLIAANADKDRFASILAHDLRGPFQSLLGLLGLLNDDIKSHTKQQIAEIIEVLYESANKTYNFLEDLLEWTQSQKMPFQPSKFPFENIWSDVINAIEASANSKQIKISNDIPLDIVLYADANMLKTVFRNLISNSIKFTHKGGNIKLASVRTDEGINISVTDTGVGMTQNVLLELFDFTNNYTTSGTSNERGSGFGLILCKEFIEKHKGNIWVESESGKGSVFTFSLPWSVDDTVGNKV